MNQDQVGKRSSEKIVKVFLEGCGCFRLYERRNGINLIRVKTVRNVPCQGANFEPTIG